MDLLNGKKAEERIGDKERGRERLLMHLCVGWSPRQCLQPRRHGDGRQLGEELGF